MIKYTCISTKNQPRVLTVLQENSMLHTQIWGAIDKIAYQNNMSCSGLARFCGLDPTAFNKSKRCNRYGKPHYPSMISLVKVMDATNMSLSDFISLVAESVNRDGAGVN